MKKASVFTMPKPRFVADVLAISVVASLPISTSLTSILLVAWLLALLPIISTANLSQTLFSKAGGPPTLLFVIAMFGVFWSEVSLIERWLGLESFLKLLAIPILILQFSGSDRARFALLAYLISCIAILSISAGIKAFPTLYWREGILFPTPFKNGPTQSGEFVSCIFVILAIALERWRSGAHWKSGALLLLSLLFLGDIVFFTAGRTSLVVGLVLIVVFACRMFDARGMMLLITLATVLIGVLWLSSVYLQQRATDVLKEIQTYKTGAGLSSSGERLEFWQKSWRILQRAPAFGHGTGSIAQQFEIETEGQTGDYATVTRNPHQQTLAVAIQLGVIGALALLIMWFAHLSLFSGKTLAAWVGLLVVVQNIVGSLFNSHLFDFTQGWTYVFGVGIAGGAVLRERTR